VVVLKSFFCPKSGETGWSGLGNWTVRFGGCHELVPASILVSAFTFGTLSCSATTSSGLFSASCFTSSLAKVLLLSHVLPCLLLGSSAEDPSFGASRSCQRLGAASVFGEIKQFGLVWHFRLSGFPILRSSCPTGGRHIRNGHLLCSSLYGQNPQQVLTIPSGSASAVTPMVCTTLPKEDKVDTSSAKAPMAQALVA
jgi:hypothetical protein